MGNWGSQHERIQCSSCGLVVMACWVKTLWRLGESDRKTTWQVCSTFDLYISCPSLGCLSQRNQHVKFTILYLQYAKYVVVFITLYIYIHTIYLYMIIWNILKYNFYVWYVLHRWVPSIKWYLMTLIYITMIYLWPEELTTVEAWPRCNFNPK